MLYTIGRFLLFFELASKNCAQDKNASRLFLLSELKKRAKMTKLSRCFFFALVSSTGNSKVIEINTEKLRERGNTQKKITT